MATTHSLTAESSRVAARRQATIDEALDHAVAIIDADGVGAVTVSEIARRMGMKAPSLYKYFPSLHAIYDAVFARGGTELNRYVDDAVEGADPGLARLVTACHAVLRWSHENQAESQLMFWRPIPGFVPSASSFQPSQGLWDRFRHDLAVAATTGQLAADADSDDVLRMLTVAIAGIVSQQMSNEPGVPLEAGSFTRLTDQVLDIFFSYYAPTTRGAQ